MQQLNALNERSLRALEYDKIINLLKSECLCVESSSLCEELRPFDNIDDAKLALTHTEDACRLSLRFGGPNFFGLHNCDDSIQRAKIGSSLTAHELLKIKSLLFCIRSLAHYRETTESMNTSLDNRFDMLAPNKFLEEKIDNAIISDDEISDSASEELARIRKAMKRTEERARTQLDKIIRSSTTQKYLQDPIVTIRGGRFVVPVKAECKSDVPGLVHDTSASGSTLFVEPMGAVEANNELKVLTSKEQKEIERILAELSSDVGSFAESIKDSTKTAIELDFIFAKSRLSFHMKASAPQLNSDGGIVLNRARHPLIKKEKVVPIDIMLGDSFDTLVVTGPNTGGKTVALKTLGLLTLMAQSGLMIPAADFSRLVFFKQVLADIGDEQSIEQSLSTFSAHMTNIVEILDNCDDQSLVLLDELGSGTDPIEGAALAVSILEHLKSCGAKIAATTHYPELKVYALQQPRVENACCEFDIATLKPTYKLLIGVPGRSNAFAISQRLGLSEHIIERSKELISSENTRFEDVMQTLEESRQKMESENREATEARIEAEKAKQEAEKLLANLEREKDKELAGARVQAKNLLERSRQQAKQLYDEIEAVRKMKNSEDIGTLKDLAKTQIGEHLKNFENIADPVKKITPNLYKLPRPLKQGDTVIISDINKTATVTRTPDKSGYVEVLAGIITTRVKLENLRLVEEKKTQRTEKTTRRTTTSSKFTRGESKATGGRNEIDLRGMTTDEALLEVDRFIDSALLSNLGIITIIHGKGTGALRAAVTRHLKSHPSIKSYRLGRFGEGEDGVTIAELK